MGLHATNLRLVVSNQYTDTSCATSAKRCVRPKVVLSYRRQDGRAQRVGLTE